MVGFSNATSPAANEGHGAGRARAGYGADKIPVFRHRANISPMHTLQMIVDVLSALAMSDLRILQIVGQNSHSISHQ